MTTGGRKPRKRRAISPLTRRILAINVLALGILVAGILYLGEYRQSLISAELAALRTQAQMFAAALGEGAITESDPGQQLHEGTTRQMVRRLAETTRTRSRIFGIDGRLVADSRLLTGAGGAVQIEELPPPRRGGPFKALLEFYNRFADFVAYSPNYPQYLEKSRQMASDYLEVELAFLGEETAMVRATQGTRLVLSVAVPVQRYKQVLGALMLSKPSTKIDAAMLDVRLDILKVFAVALAVTVGLSIYLAGTIARPIRLLAAAAERVRRARRRQPIIPDMASRDDEIGDLARSLKDMTEALWRRMDAIEAFAADVAHEIKNPLTSLQSAVETAARVKDPVHQRRLMSIIQEDVRRLNRLISDISDASRIDAELSRAEAAPVDVGAMLSTLVDMRSIAPAMPAAGNGAPKLRFVGAQGDGLSVEGIESRLVQVLSNLIANAVSFSPPGGVITLGAGRDGDRVRITVEDEGPGIPPGKEEAIFERFYSERPEGEAFGTHSGLGLSISKQIVEAHGGTIRAETRHDAAGRVIGSRFTVELPAS